MNKLILPCLLGVLIAAFPGSIKAQLTVTPGPTATPTNLVNAILGTGVTISNVITNGVTPSAYGTFNCNGPCNLGMANGAILTSGSATVAASSNTGTGQGAAINDLTDAQLGTLTTGAPRDACVLEFDFWVASDSVRFLYRFGSDEYNDYVNSQFNDVFGFFINGPNYPTPTNIALIPGTSTPVTINNVNNGWAGGTGIATGPCTNCAYYVENNNSSVTTAYDGITTELSASATICPCETYHIKLAISDVGDQVFDSGVFLKGNSFSSVGQINIFANGVQQPDAATIYVCQGGSVNLSVLNNLTCPVNITWSNGATTPTITVNQSNVGNGIFAATVTHPTNLNCFSFTTFVNVVFVTPTASITGNTSICPGGNTTLTANPGQTYLWSTGATTQSITASAAGTYTVTVSAAPNCTASASTTVTVGNATATITPAGSTNLCPGGNVTLNANSGTNYLWSTGETTQSINVSQSGGYSVTVTQTGGCSATSNVLNVTVNPAPTPLITGNFSFCSGTNTTLDAGAGFSTYLWSGGLGASQTANVITGGSYTVTVTDANGCTASTSATVTENALPTPNITGNTNICTGTTTSLDAGAGYSNYQWSGTLGSSQTAIVGNSGTYTVTVTDANGCTASTSATVTVATATATITPAGPTSFCQGDNVVLNANAGIAYLWSTGETTQSITVNQPGGFTVTVTQAGGCSATSNQINVTVNALPTPAITGATAICQGATTTFDAGPGYSSYQWSPTGSGQTNTTGTAGNYIVTVTDANGCTGSASTNLTVNPLPVPTITGQTAICQGANSTLDAGAGYSNYLWSGSGGTSQTSIVNTSGSYTVTVTDANGCTGSTSISVTVNALPTPSISGITNICQGNGTVLDAGAGYVSYQWSTTDVNQTITTGNAGTYTVTVSDANGCVGSASVTVTVNPLPIPAITGNTVICQGASTTFDAGAGYSNYQWTPSGSGQIISAATAGGYTVTVTDANGCTGSASTTLTVNPLPTPSITGNTVICQGQSTTLDAGTGFTSYQWSGGAGSSQTATVTASNNYIVTVTDANGCSATASTLVTVNPLPTPSISGNLSICQGTTTILDAGVGYSSYQWSGTLTTQTITTGIAGSYTVTVTDANGCTASTSASIVVNALPTPSISGNVTICQGSTTTFDAGAGYSAYQWNPSGTSQTITTGTAGNYTVIVTDANGCTGSASTTLTVNTASANITAQGPTTFCQGDNVVLNANNGSSYLWSNGETTQGITVNTSGSFTVTVTAANGCTAVSTPIATVVSIPTATATVQGSTILCPGDNVNIIANAGSNYLWSNGETTQTINVNQAGNYSVTVTNSIGCVATSNIIAILVSQPAASITALNPTTFCIGDSAELEANLGSSYLWNTGATTRSIVVYSAGNYTVTVTNADNCTAVSAPAQITVNTAVATITPLGSTTLCPGDNVVLQANPGQSYLWNTGDQTQSITVSSTGTFTVTVVNNNGCSEISLPVSTVVSIPQAMITPASSTTICPGSSVTLTANNGISYLWSTGETTQSISASQAGNYTVAVTNNDGCDTISTPVTIAIDVPVAIATAQGPTNFCEGDNVIITANSGSSYLWSTGETTQSISATVAGNYVVSVTNATGCTEVSNTIVVTTMSAIANITPLGPTIFCPGGDVTLEANAGLSYTWSTGETTQTIIVSDGGAYTVNVVNNNGCDATSAPVQVTISPLPEISFTADRLGGCDPFTPQFINNTITDPDATYFWIFGDSSTSTATNPSHTYSGVGLYTVTLQVTSGFGCYAEFTYPDMITVSESPEADFTFVNEKSAVTEPLQFSSTIKFTDQSVDATKWIWDFGDGFSSNEQHPTHTYSEAGEYRIKLTVLNQYDCPDTKEANILVTPFFIPNAFSPDGDGKNDAFFNVNFEMNVAAFELQIYNRWGQMVFKTDDPAKPWRGTYSDGKPAAQGVYVYQFLIKDYNEIEHEYRGHVTLLR